MNKEKQYTLKELEKAFLSFYPKWQRPLIRFLAYICGRPPKTFWETKLGELEKNQELADKLYSMIKENARLTNNSKRLLK